MSANGVTATTISTKCESRELINSLRCDVDKASIVLVANHWFLFIGGVYLLTGMMLRPFLLCFSLLRCQSRIPIFFLLGLGGCLNIIITIIIIKFAFTNIK